MSASAPLGRPSKKTGKVEAVCTSATSTGELVSVVISQAAATSFIHMQVLATIQVSHNMRKTGTDSGAKGDRDADAALLGGEALCSRCAATEASALSATAAPGVGAPDADAGA